MENLLWVITGILAIVIIALAVKIKIMQKSAKEIETAFADRLAADTNTLIDISSADRYMKSLAQSINKQLRLLRQAQQRFVQGDTELKNAVTNISHDLRTPLTAIFGYLDLLQKESKTPNTERYLNIIAERCETLKALTEELFRYSIILTAEKDLKAEEICLNTAIEESVAGYYGALTEQNISPKINLPDEKITCVADRSALNRIFSNLLSNAVKYSSGDLEITLKENGEIVFANTAPQLNEVQAGKLFDRFYTVENAGKSTGLGLAIARTLLEQMGGTATAEYQNGRLVIMLQLPK